MGSEILEVLGDASRDAGQGRVRCGPGAEVG